MLEKRIARLEQAPGAKVCTCGPQHGPGVTQVGDGVAFHCKRCGGQRLTITPTDIHEATDAELEALLRDAEGIPDSVELTDELLETIAKE